MSDIRDEFNGDDAHLVRSIESLLRLDEAGKMAPHGIGGHARTLLSAAYSRLQANAGKDNAVQQAQIWAQEARTQKGIVDEIGKLVGCANDWEMVSAVKAALSANGGEAEPVAYGVHSAHSGFEPGCEVVDYDEAKEYVSECITPLYTHPAPPSVAVPEGVDLDLVSAVLEDYANLQTSGAIPCANRYPASDVNEQAELLDMLTAGPSPDRIAEGGEVIGDHYDLGVALSRYFDDLRDPETGHIAFDPCDSNDIDELLKTISAHLSPAQSVEEIQAGALDAILIDISNLPVVDWSTVSGYLTREAARLRQSSDGGKRVYYGEHVKGHTTHPLLSDGDDSEEGIHA